LFFIDFKHFVWKPNLGNLCKWLAEQAEGMGVEIYPGIAGKKELFCFFFWLFLSRRKNIDHK
jgi:hypothetical protein